MNLGSSFRDPSGFVFKKGEEIFRAISLSYKDEYDHLMDSGLYQELVSLNMLIPHEEVILADVNIPDLYKIIKPLKIPFISYPYEWCFSQLKEAALLTLKIQEIALNFNMSLKDSSAYNIQFYKCKPVFIDTLSFEIYKRGEPWVAYNQFCKHFLAPLTLIAYRNPELGKMLRIFLDGIPLDIVSELLPHRKKIHFGIFIHIVLHAKAQKKLKSHKVNKNKKVGLKSTIGLLESLTNTVHSIKLKTVVTTWDEYYTNKTHTKEYFDDKKRIVSNFLDFSKPQIILDLGANTGEFSYAATEKGIEVISTDFDPLCVEKNYLFSRKNKIKNILPLIVNITNPSTQLGWANLERLSFLERGNFDLVLVLGLIHHLSISDNVPFKMISRMLSKMSKYIIIEFVPKSDRLVKILLENRKDIFTDYYEPKFENEFRKEFTILKKEKIKSSERTLYLMEKNCNFIKTINSFYPSA